MAKTKAELLEEAQSMGLEVTTKNTVAEITAAIAAMSQTPVEPIEAGDLEVAESGEEIQAEEAQAEKQTAKSGKRSSKGVEAAEAKAEKIEHQKHREEETTEDTPKPKQPAPKTRSRLERRGKKFREVAKQLEVGKAYGLDEAVALAQKTNPAKFDATVEMHINLSVDPRHADQNIRDNLVLPAGTGKTVRVAVFADEDAQSADMSGIEALSKDLEKGTINFDVLIATPANMPKLGKYARLLGPRGLMPNPKSGTVTTDIDKAVAEAKAGRVEYRVDSTGIVHIGVGKVSFKTPDLLQNVQAVLASIKANKPNSVKGSYLKAVYLTTSMGPSITVDLASIN